MNARTLRRVRQGLSESDAYWLRELHLAPAAVQVNVARIVNKIGEALWLHGLDIDNPQHADARKALMGTVHRFYATDGITHRGSQHVLKAEGASPDATDRENPATASPGGGPKGAGQPSADGPTRESILT